MSETLVEPAATEIYYASGRGEGLLPASSASQSVGRVPDQLSSGSVLRSRSGHRRQSSVTLSAVDLSKFGQDEGYGSSLSYLDSDVLTESDDSPTLTDEPVFILSPLAEMPDGHQEPVPVPVRSKRTLRFDDQVLVFEMCCNKYPDEAAEVYEVPACEFDRRARRRRRQDAHLYPRGPSCRGRALRAETNFLHLLATVAAFLVVGLGMMLVAYNAGRV